MCLGIPCTDNSTLRSFNSWFVVRPICPIIMYLHLLLGCTFKQVNQENMGSVEQKINGFFSVTAVNLIKDSSETLLYLEYGLVNSSAP